MDENKETRTDSSSTRDKEALLNNDDVSCTTLPVSNVSVQGRLEEVRCREAFFANVANSVVALFDELTQSGDEHAFHFRRMIGSLLDIFSTATPQTATQLMRLFMDNLSAFQRFYDDPDFESDGTTAEDTAEASIRNQRSQIQDRLVGVLNALDQHNLNDEELRRLLERVGSRTRHHPRVHNSSN